MRVSFPFIASVSVVYCKLTVLIFFVFHSYSVSRFLGYPSCVVADRVCCKHMYVYY